MKRETKILIAMSFAITIMFSMPGYAATVRGTVKYEGKVPKFREIKMDADPVCLLKHKGKAYPQTLVLGDGNTMGNVFVYVKDGIFDKKFTPPVDPVILSQEGCMYTPHIIGIMAGQPIKILNPDGTLHNVHVLSKINKEFNLAMPKFRKETTKVFEKPEFMFPIKCDVHPWMSGWVSVMDNPFFDVTKKDGEFAIGDLPAGKFHIVAWHEKLGTMTKDVVVNKADQVINFTFSRP